MILCCDTATDYATLAVCDDNGTLYAASTLRRHRDLSVRLLNDIDAVLAAAGPTFDAIDTLATGLGPGSFTGVRVAVTTFRTLAQATGKRLIGVETLALYARGLSDSLSGVCVIALLPSRRGEVYASAYSGARCIRPAFAATFDELRDAAAALAAEYRVLLTGPDGVLPAEFPVFPFVPASAPSPQTFARLAADAAQRGLFADPLGLNPLYVVAPAINQHKDPRTAARLKGLTQPV
ncbi:MAG: tRNA (adenosine(37)-N6)-threonylcarbamoyltransferase complex dimerization subunit type 1 TsaB [Capsulimonadaceae bacterium]|nr:tRNA (adenosine(37)-N6)-threonylcarbamoyltransferase complex dimerization subunit type 1 TsaB [Capsulimonadaceae bacterium]